MSESPILDLALRLWPSVRDRGMVDDPTDLDRLLEAQGQPGAPGWDGGLRNTFAAFTPEQDASAFALPSGERPQDDEAGRFIAHTLIARVLLGAGLGIDPRVAGALNETYALSWTAATGGNYHQTPLALATTLWLVALDPDTSSDHPLAIDWSAPLFEDDASGRWDRDYRLFSHYDIRERALDWSVFVSARPGRHPGVSLYTIVEPLLRLSEDGRAALALGQFAERSDEAGEGAPVPAAAVLERNRVAGLFRAHLSQTGNRPVNGRAPLSLN